MTSDHAAGDSKDESEAERLDRNFGELLQELRVGETGVQLLLASMLSIAFQQRFATLNALHRGLFVGTLLAAAVAAALFIAPVACHRMVFRQGLKDKLVQWTSRLAFGGLAFLLLAILGAVLLVVDLVAGTLVAGISTGALAGVFAWFWYLLPARWRRRPAPAA